MYSSVKYHLLLLCVLCSTPRALRSSLLWSFGFRYRILTATTSQRNFRTPIVSRFLENCCLLCGLTVVREAIFSKNLFQRLSILETRIPRIYNLPESGGTSISNVKSTELIKLYRQRPSQKNSEELTTESRRSRSFKTGDQKYFSFRLCVLRASVVKSLLIGIWL
jgi:hypothetical protein